MAQEPIAVEFRIDTLTLAVLSDALAAFGKPAWARRVSVTTHLTFPHAVDDSPGMVVGHLSQPGPRPAFPVARRIGDLTHATQLSRPQSPAAMYREGPLDVVKIRLQADFAFRPRP
jgi:hypothetical protein